MKSARRGKSLRGRFVAALLLAVVAVLSLAAAASAHQVFPYELKKTITGSTSTSGPISAAVQRVAVNQANGNVYVLDQHGGHADISQFNSNGEPQSWSGLGATNAIELPGPYPGTKTTFSSTTPGMASGSSSSDRRRSGTAGSPRSTPTGPCACRASPHSGATPAAWG